jgi:hypothetical protein
MEGARYRLEEGKGDDLKYINDGSDGSDGNSFGARAIKMGSKNRNVFLWSCGWLSPFPFSSLSWWLRCLE